MKTNFKRLLSLLLVMLMVGSMLPSVQVQASTAPDAEPTVYTDADYAAADDVFTQISAMEDAPAKKGASQTQLTDAAAEIVMASANYVEGSLERNGNSFTWWTDEGIRCIYSPYMREKYENMKAPAEPEAAGIYNEPKATKGGWPSGNQVYLIAPYYGIDNSFTDQYKNEATSIASAIGDTDGYTLYSGSAATIDKVADAIENGAVVIFDSHGTTDYDGSYVCDDPDGYEVYDYVSEANYSYLCLTTTTGITDADYDDGAAYFTDSDGVACMCVNGAAIANHMEKQSPAGLLWMAICLGMATDTFAVPMREMGVEVVYGYSQSVTFAGDYCFEGTFWDNMIAGKDVATSIAAMKSTWGNWDWSDEIASYYGYSGYTLSEARQYRSAFPIVVSDEDTHPGQRGTGTDYGACSEQTVKSTYTLYSQYAVTAQSNNTSYGTVSASGSTITATPATGYFAESADVVSGTATVTQNGNTFSVLAESDCTVQINFAPKTAVTVSFSGATVAAQSGYAGDSMTLPTAEAPEGYKFLGWMTAPLSEDTTEKPSYYTDSFIPTASTTLYALYSYVDENSGSGTGDYVKVTSTPADWSGEYVIVYESGSMIMNSSLATLDANDNYVSVSITDSTISAAEGDPYKVTIAAMDGGYSIMTAAGTYISGTSGSNKLNTGTTPAANTLSIDANGDATIISNSTYLRFNTSANRFRYYKSSSYSSQGAVALYLKDGTAGTTYYTTTLCDHANTVEVAEVAATCTADGCTAGVKCSDCNATISGCEVIPATGHSYGDWTVTTEAGCETAGEQAHTCSVCGDVETETFAATGHSVGEGTVTTAATCTTDGVMSYSCSSCGNTTTEAIPATGHSYVANGLTYTCSVCGDSYTAPSSTTLQYVFSDYTAGTQYAQGENHTLDDVVTLTINGAHLNSQIRLYAGSNAVFTSTKVIDSIIVKAGNKAGTLNVYGSEDGSTWNLIAAQSTTASYTDYSFDMPDGTSYKYLKLESVGAQIRVSEMTIVVLESATTEPDPEEPTEPDVTEPDVTEPEETQPADTVSDGTYVIHTADGIAMTALDETYTYGYIYTTTVTVANGVVSGHSDTNIFTLQSNGDGTYALIDSYGRYLYMTGTYNSFNVSAELPDAGAAWSLTDNGDGTYTIVNVAMSKTIGYSSSYSSFGAYADASGYDCALILTPVADCQHSNTTTSTVDATCTTAGSTTVICDDCGATVSEETVPATGHSYVDGICSVCGDEEPESSSARYYIAAIRDSGNYFYMTSDLGSSSTSRYQAVDSGLTVLPETITAPETGYVFILIDNGDGTYSLQAEGVEGDNYLGWTSGNSGLLVAADSALKVTVDITGGIYQIHFTGDAERYLSLNNTNAYFAWYKSGQVKDLVLIPVVEEEAECTHANTTSTTVDATCTEAGSTTVVCDDCGETVSQETIPANGHSYVSGTCSVCGAADPDYVVVLPSGTAELKFSGATLKLEADLTMNVLVNSAVFAEGNYTNGRVEISMTDAKTGITNTVVYTDNYNVNGNYREYVFTGISPRKMNDTITLTVYGTYTGVEYSKTMTYSVATYAYNKLKTSTDTKFLTLLADLLNFGSAHQIYTNYNTDNLVNANMTDTQKGYASTGDLTLTNKLNAQYEVIDAPTASFRGASLVLTEKVEIQYIVVVEDLTDVSLKVTADGVTYTVDSSEFVAYGSTAGWYTVNVSFLQAKQMRSNVTAAVYCGDTVISNTALYSVESYAAIKLSDTDTKLVNLLKMMMYYGDSAAAYFA